MKWPGVWVSLLLCWACGPQPPSEPVAASAGEETPGPAAANTPEQPGEAEEALAIPEDEGQLAVTVYYRHPVVEAMVAHQRRVFNHEDPTVRISQVINMLSIAPEGEYRAIWPSGSYIRELYILADGTLVIDFKQNTLDRLSVGAETEELMVYSLVNSVLESFPELTFVRMLVDGEIRETLLGHIDIEFPLELGLNRYIIVPERDDEEDIAVEELPQNPEPAPPTGKMPAQLDKSI